VCICVCNVYIRFVVLAALSSRIFDRYMCCLEIGQIGLKIDTHNEKFFGMKDRVNVKRYQSDVQKGFTLSFTQKNAISRARGEW